MKVDLHMHTSCSDGIYKPQEILAMAEKAGLETIAITDHDTIDAYKTVDIKKQSIRVIAGIEMSTEYENEDVHVLGYHIDLQNRQLQEYCTQFQTRRLRRALAMVDRCIALGYDLDRDEVEALLHRGGTVGRPHIARMLIAKGYYGDIKSVFEKILYRGGPAYIPYQKWTIGECIDLIHAAGGLAVLAHPGMLHRHLSDVLQFGFDGLEVYHPKNKNRYEEFLQIGKEKHWYISGGSDFHGVPGRFPETVGLFSVDDTLVKPLLTYRCPL
jgi:predicted metal-dependent phosphoesterase TrpH